MKKFGLFILTLFCLASCNDDDDKGTTPGQVVIDPVITGATQIGFEDNDEIGVTITTSDASPYKSNTKFIYFDGKFSGNLLWYPNDSDKSVLTAYYPYSSSGAPGNFTVQADQSTANGYKSSDLLGANKEDVVPTSNSVSMVFEHMLTKIVIDLENESGSAIRSIALKGSKPTANIDLTKLTATVDATVQAADITAQTITADQIYRAILVPQTASITLTVTTAAGKTLEQDLDQRTMAGGKQYRIKARIEGDKLRATMSEEAENWTQEATTGPMPDDVDFKEYADHFIYDGDRYDIVTLANGATWMAQPMRYVPKGYTPSADPLEESHIWYPYKIDGTATALTDRESVTKLGYLYDAYAAFGGQEVTPENCYDFEGIQGICPPGWRIPTRADYYELCGNSNKNDLGETGTQIKNDALFFDTGYQAAKVASFNDAGFNFVFSGTRMLNNLTTATPQYSATATTPTNCSVTEWIGNPSLNYHITSTCYKPYWGTSGDVLTYIQFFAMSTTFTSGYPEGKVSIMYIHHESGQQLRCVKNAE